MLLLGVPCSLASWERSGAAAAASRCSSCLIPTVGAGFGLGVAEAPALSPGERGNRANGISRSQSGETREQAGWGRGRRCP